MLTSGLHLYGSKCIINCTNYHSEEANYMNLHPKWFYRCLALLLILSMLPVAPVMQAVASATGTDTRAVISAASVCVPAYSGGTSSGWMTYDCGSGLTFGNTGSESRMQIVTGTTEAQFKAYCTNLEGNNYTKIYSKTVAAVSGNNLYAKYLSNDGTHSLYTYFTAAFSQTRIIVDTQNQSFRTFSYNAAGNYRNEFYMYGLSNCVDSHVPDEGEISWQYRSTGGALLIFRMADNSLFLIDGGGYDQMSDRACEEFMAFLRRITGIDEGQKIVINTWFITHPHVDHCGGIGRFWHKYSEHFELVNIMYNFDVLSASTDHIRRVSRLFPNAQYYKQHTGESFNVCDVQFDVLYTVEDRYYPNTDNELIKADKTCMDNTNENNISTVLRATMGDKKLILTGDIGNADTILMKMYPPTALKADLLQLPHHGYDNHTALANMVSPAVSILNQAGTAVANRKNIYNFNASWAPYAGTIYYGGTHTIGYAADTGVFLVEEVNGVDYLDWNARTYEFREDNPCEENAKVYAPEMYYRYSKVNRLASAQKAYLIVDNKLNRVLSYDAADATVASSRSGLFDGEHWYFADADRHAVNWLIYGKQTAQPHTNSPVTDAEITYYNDLTISKGTGSYWSTGTNPTGMVLGNGDTFTATGMYDSWCPFTQELESTSKWTWMDALPDDSFLIYRHTGGYYYPLYRDGNVADGNGWGIAKFTSKSAVTEKLDYLKTNLYLYEETASKMHVTWTGHKDYTCYTGIPLNNLLSLLTADIRVNWTMDSFGASGEVFHTSLERKNPGEYWLEFSSAYNASVAADYTVTIKYKTANGTIIDAGSFNLHVQGRSPEDLGPKELSFGFGDTAADRYKYRNESQYSEYNFDGTSRWLYTEHIAATNVTTEIPGQVNVADGTLTVRKTKATDESNTMFVEAYAKGTTPLNFNPKHAEVMQIRYKTENLKAVKNQEPSIRLWYYKSDGTRTYDRNYSLGTDYTSDGEYKVITVKLYTAQEIAANSSVSGFPTQSMNSLSKVTGIGLGVHDLTLKDPAGEGSVTVDFIYVGPEEGAPVKHGYQTEVTLPTCSAQGYTTHFCEHCGESYRDTYTAKDPTRHTYTNTVSKNPTVSATGILSRVCACGSSTAVTLPKLSTADYIKSAVTAPTCTAAGTECYQWTTTDYGIFTFTASVAALGHDYDCGVITKYPTLSATGVRTFTCLRDSSHTYTQTAQKLHESIYMGFENIASDRVRYDNAVYGFRNFDNASYWNANNNGSNPVLAIPVVDHEAGTLTVHPGNNGNTLIVQPSESSVATPVSPLYFDPTNAEFIQVRLKFENVGCIDGKNALVAIDPYTSSGKLDTEDYIFTEAQIEGNEFLTVRIPLTAAHRSKGNYTKFRLFFTNMTLTTASKVVIDYIYIGSETVLPPTSYAATFKNADGTILQTERVYEGETAVYSGATPTKVYDSANHYAFKAWDKALTNITADTTFTATYTATAHSYTYSNADAANHKASCICGHSKTLPHAWNSGIVTKQPTCTAVKSEAKRS